MKERSRQGRELRVERNAMREANVRGCEKEEKRFITATVNKGNIEQ
jgi:hypothetical protein